MDDAEKAERKRLLLEKLQAKKRASMGGGLPPVVPAGAKRKREDEPPTAGIIDEKMYSKNEVGSSSQALRNTPRTIFTFEFLQCQK